MTVEEEGRDAQRPQTLPLPEVAPLSEALTRVVAEAYADVLKEAMPERMMALIESIKRLEAGQKKSD